MNGSRATAAAGVGGLGLSLVKHVGLVLQAESSCSWARSVEGKVHKGQAMWAAVLDLPDF